MPLKVVQFAAVILTALALVPSGAHLFAFLNKIDLSSEQYFIVQNIYRGWDLFGIALCGALIWNLEVDKALFDLPRRHSLIPQLLDGKASALTHGVTDNRGAKERASKDGAKEKLRLSCGQVFLCTES